MHKKRNSHRAKSKSRTRPHKHIAIDHGIWIHERGQSIATMSSYRKWIFQHWLHRKQPTPAYEPISVEKRVQTCHIENKTSKFNVKIYITLFLVDIVRNKITCTRQSASNRAVISILISSWMCENVLNLTRNRPCCSWWRQGIEIRKTYCDRHCTPYLTMTFL